MALREETRPRRRPRPAGARPAPSAPPPPRPWPTHPRPASRAPPRSPRRAPPARRRGEERTAGPAGGLGSWRSRRTETVRAVPHLPRRGFASSAGLGMEAAGEEGGPARSEVTREASRDGGRRWTRSARPPAAPARPRRRNPSRRRVIGCSVHSARAGCFRAPSAERGDSGSTRGCPPLFKFGRLRNRRSWRRTRDISGRESGSREAARLCSSGAGRRPEVRGRGPREGSGVRGQVL